MEVDLTRLLEVAILIWPVAVSFLGGYGVMRWEWGCTGGNTVKSQDGITVENQRWNYSENPETELHCKPNNGFTV